jgi:hypothetical protein
VGQSVMTLVAQWPLPATTHRTLDTPGPPRAATDLPAQPLARGAGRRVATVNRSSARGSRPETHSDPAFRLKVPIDKLRARSPLLRVRCNR